MVVGTGVNTKLLPKSCKEGWLRVYAIKEQGRVLEFMHKVSTDGVGRIMADKYRPRRMMYPSVWLGSRDRCWLVLVSHYDCMRWERRHCCVNAKTV